MSTRAAPAHARLREATGIDHARVDACFPNGLQDAASYRRYLGGMQRLLHALADADADIAREFAPHRRHIEADLRGLGMRPAAPAGRIDIALDGDDARLGARYVIEGSALGARILQRQAHALGYDASGGAGFLAYHVQRGTTHWPRLMQALAQHDPASPGFHALLAAARDTFALAAACFDPMGPPAEDTDEGQDRD